MDDSPSQSFFKKHWEGFTGFWSERFSFLDKYTRFKNLPSWSSSDVEEFIASDPVHGPVLKTTREAVNYGLTGSIIGAVSTAGLAYKYSKSLHGAGLSFVAGGVFGWHLAMKLQITRFNFTDWIPPEHKLSSWNGGRGNLKDDLKVLSYCER